MIELGLGLLVAAMLGARGEMIAVLGVPVGIVLYFASCLYWDSVPCWWPWCSAWKKTKQGPGRRRRRRWTCRLCGGSGLRRRWGARLMGRT